MTARLLPALGAAWLLLAAPAGAEPALRPVAVVDEAVIRLSDLFDEAGPNAARVVGPAPGPGRRVVVEAAQLLAIARANGVAWRPMTAADQAVVERSGRALRREEVLEALRAVLAPMGLDAETEIELPGFQPPVVPASAFAQVSVEGASLEAATGRFSATLVTAAEGMPTIRMRVTGRAMATVSVLVATRRLGLGEAVRPGDVRLVRMRAAAARPGLATDPAQAVGKVMRRPVAEGAGIAASELGVPAVVEKGSAVTMVMEGPGVSMTAQGRAMASAGRGEMVTVMNLASRSLVEGEALGPGRVRVAFGSVPVTR